MSRGGPLGIAIIALGSNVAGSFADPAAAVEAAMLAVGALGRAAARSRLYRSIAWPCPTDPEFANAAMSLDTELSPADLLARLHGIEAEFGRIRRLSNAPRTLDLDLIDYAGTVSAPGESPVLPHPRLAARAFVLLPMVDIAPNWRHPVTDVGIADLILALPDDGGTVPL